ncbi:MAG TPA: hypothetical protein DHW82_03815 [Spirochaetia bacterium]|nr:MAG: hypothetical protein A2Y41_06825 [Spirochaetes bacterium GWB1_36_13]HCL56120.1 hypothetical protein [Spirochaetia bacterium]
MNWKRLLSVAVFMMLIVSCVPTPNLIVKSNKEDTEFFYDGVLIGSGKEASTIITDQREYMNDYAGRHTVVAKKEGYKPVQVVIQPNYNNMHDSGIHIFVWTLGWIALEPLWYWVLQGWRYEAEDGSNNLFVNVEFKE